MSFENTSPFQNMKAGGAIVDKTFVKLNTTTMQVVTSTASLGSIGVAGMDADSGESVLVKTFGAVEVVAGGAIAVGDKVKVGTGGKVTATTTGGDAIVGYALTAAGADGEILTILLQKEVIPST